MRYALPKGGGGGGGGTILNVPVRHVHPLMPGNVARLVLLGEEGVYKDT